MSLSPQRTPGDRWLPLFVLVIAVTFAARASDSVLVFNEIQYHPVDGTAATEWIELRSLQGVNVDIGGWRIEGGIDYTFPNGTVMPGHGYLIVAAVPEQFASALGPFTGELDNGGDTIRLVNRNGRLMDELTYDDEGEWPVSPDGSGCTLSRVSASAGVGPSMWAGSAAIFGSAGAANPAQPAPTLVFSEISGANDGGFFIEFQNQSNTPVSTSDWSLKTSTNLSVTLPGQTVAPGGFASFTGASLGLTPVDGMELFLLAPGGAECRDARELTNRLRGLTPEGRWGHPDGPTPEAANIVTVSDVVVINEIFYHGVNNSAEQWIELHNRSAAPVNVGRWKFTDGVNYDLAPGTTIPEGGFLIVAWDPAAFAALHPGVSALGPFSGSLSGRGETITLRDANDNVADQVAYADSGRWSTWADGGGSSLELRDPDADNSKGEAWDGSDESAGSTWQTVTYSGTAATPNFAHAFHYNEFVFGLLNSGEFLIDDISVKDVTQGNVELIQNGTFGGGAAAWRIIGTHAGTVIDDPTAAGNSVLKVSASAATEHMHNHAETTLKNGASYHAVVATDTYSISFRAKWLRGSNLLHTRLWHNRLPSQTLLNRPTTGGTPGAVNGRRVANLGPTFAALAHAPVVPAAAQPATVSIKVADPDGIASVQLFTSVNGGAVTAAEMVTTGSGIYTATVAGQATSALVQFYIQASDTLGAASFFPAAGPASRAMIPWADGRAQLTLASGAKPHNIRVVLPTADATELYKPENLMSDRAVPCTVILDESTVFYRVGVRLKSSEHGRISEGRCGYTLEFPSDDLFFGQHDAISIDRSGGTSAGQKEILLKRLENTAGGIYASEDDIVRVISARGIAPPAKFTGNNMTGPAILAKTRLDREFLDAQWPNGGEGSQHKYERVYVLTETINPTTRAVTPISTSNVLSAVSEQPKVPQDSTGPPGVAVTNLGTKENYRWYWLLQNARDADDFRGIMDVTNAIGQSSGANFNNLVTQYINVSAWLRATVPASLYGVVDNYLGTPGSGQHNALIYFPPGQKAVLIPWDLDFLGQSNPTTTPIATGGDVGKFLANPVWKRMYWGHVLDILNRSFNSAYMSTWAAHYSRFGTDDMTASVTNYLTPRANYARSQVSAQVASVTFARTSPSPVTVSTPFATVSGDGWVNIAEIRLAGATKPLAVTWTDENSWTLQLPVSAGTNTFTLEAYDASGAPAGTTTVTITGEGGLFAAGPGDLIISELNYNPSGPDDTMEFIELLNVTGAALDLTGCHFDEELGQGINYTFPAGVQILPARERILVARNRDAFLAAYPAAAGQVAPNQYDPGDLDNAGESLVLYSAGGMEIFRFSYPDAPALTDGGGRSLVRVVSSSAPSGATYLWRGSTGAGGNPGTTDALAFSGAVTADLDVDGLPALLEYVFGTSDAAPGGMSWSFTQDARGRWLVTFPRVINADDAAISIESVSNLGGTWGPAIATLISSSLTGTIVTETWQITTLDPASFFLRLKATQR